MIALCKKATNTQKQGATTVQGVFFSFFFLVAPKSARMTLRLTLPRGLRPRGLPENRNPVCAPENAPGILTPTIEWGS